MRKCWRCTVMYPDVHVTNIFYFIFVGILLYVIIHKYFGTINFYTKMLLNNKVYLSSQKIYF